MTNFTAILVSPIRSDHVMGVKLPSLFKDSAAELTTVRANDGTKSLVVQPGGSKDIYVVCAAGSRTITVQVWPESDTDKCGLVIYDADNMGEEIGSDWSAGSGAWEELSVGFTATAKVYIARLVNGALFTVSDAKAWFDTLEVA